MAMVNNEQFQIIYDGPALESNEMDVRDLAPALLAMGDLLEEANRVIYGGDTQVHVNVKGSFKTGSFQVDFSLVQSIVQQIIRFATSPEGVTSGFILDILGFDAQSGFGLIPLIKWIRNRKIKRASKTGVSRTTIEIDDELMEVEDKVISLYQNSRIRKDLELVIAKPLQRTGVECIGIMYRGNITSIEGNEKEYFRLPDTADEVLSDEIIEASVQAVAVSFIEDNKWRFSDGASTFFAEVQDKDFIKRVQESTISFAKGDILKVRMRKRQYITNSDMKTDYYILEVLNQRSPAKQIPLPFK